MTRPRWWRHRPHLTGEMRGVWGRLPVLWLGHVCDVLTALGLGCALLLGDRARTTAPVYALLNANGGPVVWGAVLLGLGLLLAAGPFVSERALFWILLTLATIYGLFAWWFIAGAVAISTASFVGGIFMVRAVITHVIRAVAYQLERM